MGSRFGEDLGTNHYEDCLSYRHLYVEVLRAIHPSNIVTLIEWEDRKAEKIVYTDVNSTKQPDVRGVLLLHVTVLYRESYVGLFTTMSDE